MTPELEKDWTIKDGLSDFASRQLCGVTVYDWASCPRVDVSFPKVFLEKESLFKKHFLSASYLSNTVQFVSHRTYGVYYFGEAKATFHYISKVENSILIETSSWDGIKDMEILLEKIHAGSIAPTISFEVEQVKVTQFKILYQTMKEILATHKLPRWKRFVLALRLARG
ncbi:MAG: hypothetical protein WCO35_01660 [Candidatus Nomurabacteria bacterium]